MISTGKTPDSSTRKNSWQSCQQRHLAAKQDDLGEGNYDFSLRSIVAHPSKLFSTYHKILRHSADGFTSLPKKDVLRILIAFKHLSHRPGLNRDPWVQWQDANRYITEATVLGINLEEHETSANLLLSNTKTTVLETC
jgi:hypothetical protein